MDFNLPIMNSRDVLKNRTTMSTWEGVRETRDIGVYFYLLMNFYFSSFLFPVEMMYL